MTISDFNLTWSLRQYEREPSFDTFFLKFGILILDSTINVGTKHPSFLQHSFQEIK